MKLGVSLAEQGYDVVPAALLDWLHAIDDVVHQQQEAPGGTR